MTSNFQSIAYVLHIGLHSIIPDKKTNQLSQGPHLFSESMGVKCH
uniref:Uncharacterized protein n=1 Tax=Anguilla anguilla TaxID=7936 RepID=A0A0E9PR65_ANGAN